MPEGMPGGAAGKAALPTALAGAASPAGSSAGRRELRKGVLAGALGALLAAGTLLHAVDFWEATECDLDGQLHAPPVHDLGPAAAPAEVQPGEEVTWRARRGGGGEGGVEEAADRRSPPPVPTPAAVAGGAAGRGEERLVVTEAAKMDAPADVRAVLHAISTTEQKGKWPEELPFAALRRSLVATGRRSHEFARKLRTGQPVTIAVVGGSSLGGNSRTQNRKVVRPQRPQSAAPDAPPPAPLPSDRFAALPQRCPPNKSGAVPHWSVAGG